ncbi:hypothetical protein ABZ234_07905 [Nocardiopsis sp. NPDC006198]|uniref:hypothetical protein n=1 Tax=Nocardiopsis sp. NPDC006198 TaxID=3154472 RepID=UPI0033A5EBC4
MANLARRVPLRAVDSPAKRRNLPQSEPDDDGKMLYLKRGDRLHVDRADQTHYDFVGSRGFYMMSVELSAKLPHMGLNVTDYDIFHTLLGKLRPRKGRKGDLEGLTIRVTQQDIADELGIVRQQVGESLQVLADRLLLWTKRGKVTVNPRCVFVGKSELQARAIANIPEDIPEIELPTTKVRPPRRRRKLKVEG